MNGQRVHAAKGVGETDAILSIQMQRRFAIGLARKRYVRKRLLQLDVIVNLSIGDNDRAAGFVDRLIAGLEVDDCQADLGEPDAARDMQAVSVRTAMRDCTDHAVEEGAVGRRTVTHHKACDSAHYDVTFSKKAWYWRTTLSCVKAPS